MGHETAVARYQDIVRRTGERPSKRLRKKAWTEARALLGEAEGRDRLALRQLRERAAKNHQAAADGLYGAEKYGRDVTQPLVIPLYFGTPPREPEHGFRLIYVDGMPMRLWYDGAWVCLSGDRLRAVESSGLRTELAAACRYQEMRKWAVDRHLLNFRDAAIDASEVYRTYQLRRAQHE